MQANTKNRDDYFRCKVCKKLYADEECSRDEKTGAFICPLGCVEPYNQPEYESPLISETPYEDS
jgi:hypothetical protein